jgi:hypothetical protein
MVERIQLLGVPLCPHPHLVDTIRLCLGRTHPGLPDMKKSGLHATDSERSRWSAFRLNGALPVLLSKAKDLSAKRGFGVPPQTDTRDRSCHLPLFLTCPTGLIQIFTPDNSWSTSALLQEGHANPHGIPPPFGVRRAGKPSLREVAAQSTDTSGRSEASSPRCAACVACLVPLFLRPALEESTQPLNS